MKKQTNPSASARTSRSIPSRYRGTDSVPTLTEPLGARGQWPADFEVCCRKLAKFESTVNYGQFDNDNL